MSGDKSKKCEFASKNEWGPTTDCKHPKGDGFCSEDNCPKDKSKQKKWWEGKAKTMVELAEVWEKICILCELRKTIGCDKADCIPNMRKYVSVSVADAKIDELQIGLIAHKAEIQKLKDEITLLRKGLTEKDEEIKEWKDAQIEEFEFCSGCQTVANFEAKTKVLEGRLDAIRKKYREIFVEIENNADDKEDRLFERMTLTRLKELGVLLEQSKDEAKNK
jgi:hypothetical protein